MRFYNAAIICSILFVSISTILSAPPFKEWLSSQNRLYLSHTETEYRERIYNDNIKLIEKLNSIYSPSTQFSVNQFADTSPEEFKFKILMPVRPPMIFPDSSIYQLKLYLTDGNNNTNITIPDSFDWRSQNVVSSVKNQGTVGSCWSFSTVGNLEGQWALKSKELISLSAEMLIDCDGTSDVINSRADCGVFGGWPYLAYQYIKKIGGIESEETYPYCSGTGACYPCVPNNYNKSLCGPPPLYCNKTTSCLAKLDSSKFVAGLKINTYKVIEGESLMAPSLISLGPLSVLMNANHLQFYHSGVLDPITCTNKDLDHAVLLVGYGIHKTVLGHKIPYWLVKNSWGAEWGMKGYFMLARGKGVCGIDKEVTTAILE